jgi:hypothetical protein
LVRRGPADLLHQQGLDPALGIVPGDPRQTQFRGQGHPVYACPEQLQGQPSQPDHDLYSVATILYYLASGETPPRAVDRWEGSANEVPLAELRPDLPADWCARVDWMRRPRGEERPRSVAHLLEK